MNIARIEYQPNFPKEDVTDANAAMLEFLLYDTNLVDRTHELSESNVYLYHLGHEALKRHGIANDYSIASRVAFSHGAAAYETIATFVRPVAPQYDYFQTLHKVSDILNLANDGSRASIAFMDARDRFESEQPNTATIIKAAEKIHGIPLPIDYLIIGAAVERQLEIDLIDSAV